MPLGTVQQMMAEHVQPTADTFWGAVRFESVLEDGVVVERDIRPETDADWEEARQAAERLGEYGEMLMTPAYSEGRGEDWTDFSQGLVDVAQIAEQAALDRNADAIFEVGGTIYNVCQACHQMYPPEVMPEGVTVDDLRPTEGVPLDDYLEETETQ